MVAVMALLLPAGCTSALESKPSTQAQSLAALHELPMQPAPAPATTSQPTQLVPATPTRVLDTRTTTGALGSANPVIIDFSDRVPSGTTAVTLNVTATGQTASGFAEAAPAGAASGSSTVNWGRAQQTVANGHISRLSDDGKVQLSVTSTGTAHLVVDLTGCFAPTDTPKATVYNSADRRIFDSRDSGSPLGEGESKTITIHSDSPPSSPPTAAAVNVTVTGTTGSGVLTTARSPTPGTSTVNWTGANQTIANAVITDVSAEGSFTVTNYGSPAHVVVDLTGTFTPAATGVSGSSFYAQDPRRTYDSRVDSAGPLTAGTSRVTSAVVPEDAVAVAINTTITGNTGTGFIAITPPAVATPRTSTLNWFTSPTTRANGSIIGVTQGRTRAYVGGFYATHYVHDVAGYFRAVGAP